MTPKEVIQKCSNLGVDEEREATDQYAEVVFYNKDLDQWTKVLAETLGQAKKPAGTEPSEEDTGLAKDFGGIFKNQTLFKKEIDDSTMIAMFWPWQDNIHTTLKVALLKR